ncbi:MAG: hypothetical protein ACLGPL_07225 [Acidobacteriota bacterium]
MNSLVVTVIFISLLISSSLYASSKPVQSDIPNVDFRVAANRKDADVPQKGIYIFHLYCGLGQCTLELLTLNECERDDAGELAFNPKTLLWASWAGNLEVRSADKDTLSVTVFQGSHHARPAYLKFRYVSEMPFARRVTAFEAKGFIDYRSPEIGDGMEFCPLTGKSVRVPLDCPVLLPGVEE